MKNMKIEHGELTIKKPFAECKEIKCADENMARMINNAQELRIYRHSWETLTFQIRTYAPTTEWNTGKKRLMMADVSLSIEEIKAIYDFAKKAICRQKAGK